MAKGTEPPSSKKLDDARDKGQVAKSRELVAAGVLAVAASALGMGVEPLAVRLADLARMAWSFPAQPPLDALESSVDRIAGPVVVALTALAAVAVLGHLVQLRASFRWKTVALRWERVDPSHGISRLVSMRSAVEVAKMLLIIVCVVAASGGVIVQVLPALWHLPSSGAASTLSAFLSVGSLVLWAAAGVLSVIGVADLFYQRWQLRYDLRMTHEEVRRERKEEEGDPSIKAARRRAYQELVVRAVLDAVRTADVLIVNPIHVAVALRYDADREGAAPEIAARGQEELARRMIETAEASGVAVMRDVPLARSLFLLEVGEEIPESLFEAVAEVLQAAWRLRDAESADQEDA